MSKTDGIDPAWQPCEPGPNHIRLMQGIAIGLDALHDLALDDGEEWFYTDALAAEAAFKGGIVLGILDEENQVVDLHAMPRPFITSRVVVDTNGWFQGAVIWNGCLVTFEFPPVEHEEHDSGMAACYRLAPPTNPTDSPSDNSGALTL